MRFTAGGDRVADHVDQRLDLQIAPPDVVGLLF